MIHIQGINDQIDGLEDFVSVGWIGVNMKPAEHLVCALITKWIYVYTNFISKQVHMSLRMYHIVKNFGGKEVGGLVLKTSSFGRENFGRLSIHTEGNQDGAEKLLIKL